MLLSTLSSLLALRKLFGPRPTQDGSNVTLTVQPMQPHLLVVEFSGTPMPIFYLALQKTWEEGLLTILSYLLS